MTITLQFVNADKNNTIWWNRLFDKIEKIEPRNWNVTGGSINCLSATFSFTMKDGSDVPQLYANQIFDIFITNQLFIDKFIVNNKDITPELLHL